MRIMVVDDEPIVRISLQFLLESVGIEAVCYEDGADAVDAFRAAPGRFDAIVSDLAMPQMGGAELCDQIRGIDSKLPILILSGLLEDERVERDGVTGTLAKPAQLHEILGVLESLGLDVSAATAAA